jgi:Tfp pilus assembly protein PilN
LIRINLAPVETTQRPRRRRVFLTLLLVFALMTVTVLGGYALGGWRFAAASARLRVEIADAEAELGRLLTSKAEGQTGLEREADDVGRRLTAIASLAREAGRPVRLLEAVADLVPARLWLTRIEDRQGRLRIAGRADATSTVAQFMATLEASGRFKEIDLVESREDAQAPPWVMFELACRFEI